MSAGVCGPWPGPVSSTSLPGSSPGGSRCEVGGPGPRAQFEAGGGGWPGQPPLTPTGRSALRGTSPRGSDEETETQEMGDSGTSQSPHPSFAWKPPPLPDPQTHPRGPQLRLPRAHALTHTGTNRHCSYTILPSLHGCLSPPSPFLLLARSSLARGQPGIPLLTCCFHLLIIPNISEGLHTARGQRGWGLTEPRSPPTPFPQWG